MLACDPEPGKKSPPRTGTMLLSFLTRQRTFLMLYKFKSKAAGDLIMLEPNGRRVLEIIGKDAGPKGIVLPGDMPGAIALLEAAIAKEEADQKALAAEARARGEVPPRFDAVSLRQRAVPFLDMLRRCDTAGQEIVWGV